MKLNINVATSWNELNDYQIKKISSILFNKTINKDTLYKQLIFYLFIDKPRFWKYIKFRILIHYIPIRQLYPYVFFLDKNIQRTRFIRKIKINRHVFYGPRDRLSNLTIEEFSAADLFFYYWITNNSYIDLDRLITVLYRKKAKISNSIDIRQPYSEFDLHKRGEIIPKLDLSTKLAIGLTYLGCREEIIKKYPVVFSKRRFKNEEKKQSQTSKSKYLSFTPVMYALSYDEIQPLGDFSKVKKTLINPFFGILTESIIRQKRIEKELKKVK